jgi:hypothetical protein
MAVLAAAICIIVIATLIPRHGSPAPSFFCLTCDEKWGVDVILNLSLFVPLGFALYWLELPPARIAVIAFGCSSVIEFLQWSVVPGRDPSIRDILANGTGAVLAGWTALAVATVLRGDRPIYYRKALAVVLAAWSLQALVTGWALVPEAPAASVYYGQWGHVFPGTVPFRGKVLSARLNDMPIRDDSLPETPLIRESIARAGVALEVRVDSLPASPAEAQVFGLVTGPTRIIGLDIVRRGVLFQVRSRSSQLGLMRPALLVAQPVSPVPGIFDIRAILQRGRMSVEVLAGNGLVKAQHWRLSATQGWALIVPRPFPASLLPLWSLGWILGFSVPAGVFACGAAGSLRGALRAPLVVAAVMLLPLMLAAALFHCALPTPIDVLGIVGGCLAGVPVAHLLRAQRSGTSATKRS